MSLIVNFCALGTSGKKSLFVDFLFGVASDVCGVSLLILMTNFSCFAVWSVLLIASFLPTNTISGSPLPSFCSLWMYISIFGRSLPLLVSSSMLCGLLNHTALCFLPFVSSMMASGDSSAIVY